MAVLEGLICGLSSLLCLHLNFSTINDPTNDVLPPPFIPSNDGYGSIRPSRPYDHPSVLSGHNGCQEDPVVRRCDIIEPPSPPSSSPLIQDERTPLLQEALQDEEDNEKDVVLQVASDEVVIRPPEVRQVSSPTSTVPLL